MLNMSKKGTITYAERGKKRKHRTGIKAKKSSNRFQSEFGKVMQPTNFTPRFKIHLKVTVKIRSVLIDYDTGKVSKVAQ
jgi:hypothetical protein